MVKGVKWKESTFFPYPYILKFYVENTRVHEKKFPWVYMHHWFNLNGEHTFEASLIFSAYHILAHSAERFQNTCCFIQKMSKLEDALLTCSPNAMSSQFLN